MRTIFVFLAISMLVGIDGVRRERTKGRRHLPLPEQPNATEEIWPKVDIQKIERRQDFWQNDTDASGVKDLQEHDTVLVGDSEMPLSESSNVSRQIHRGWAQTPSHQPSEQSSYGLPQTLPGAPQSNPPLPPGCLAPRGQYPSLNNCANYLNCWDEVVIEETCPNGLLFNDVTGLCDFEYNVNCGNRPAATPKPPLPTGAKRCPGLNGRYRSASNCSEFYVCLSGSPIKFSCPPGLVYNDVVNVCDYVYNVDCQGAATPPPLLPPKPDTSSLTVSGLQRPLPPRPIQQTQRPQAIYPSGAYHDDLWQGRNAETDSWHEDPVTSQPEIGMKPEPVNNDTPDESVESDPTEAPTIQSPWDMMHSVPEELSKVPCVDGNVHRLDESCTSVIVCRNERPQLVQCSQGLMYDRPSDSCQHVNTAEC